MGRAATSSVLRVASTSFRRAFGSSSVALAEFPTLVVASKSGGIVSSGASFLRGHRGGHAEVFSYPAQALNKRTHAELAALFARVQERIASGELVVPGVTYDPRRARYPRPELHAPPGAYGKAPRRGYAPPLYGHPFAHPALAPPPVLLHDPALLHAQLAGALPPHLQHPHLPPQLAGPPPYYWPYPAPPRPWDAYAAHADDDDDGYGRVPRPQKRPKPSGGTFII